VSTFAVGQVQGARGYVYRSEAYTSVAPPLPTYPRPVAATVGVQAGISIKVEALTEVPPQFQTEADRAAYLAAVAKIPSFESLMEIAAPPPSEWLADTGWEAPSDK
jgi:hypothetical protein